MFESFTSRAHQSAVDRLIQMATGKKAPAEQEAPGPESTETAAAVAEQPVAEGNAEAVAEQPQVEAAVEAPVEQAQAEAPAETAPEAVMVVESAAAAVFETVVEAQPVQEPVSEPPQGEAPPVYEPAAEAVAEPVAEAVPEAAAAAEPVSEAVMEQPAEPAPEAASAVEFAVEVPVEQARVEVPVETQPEAAAVVEAPRVEAMTAEAVVQEPTPVAEPAAAVVAQPAPEAAAEPTSAIAAETKQPVEEAQAEPEAAAEAAAAEAAVAAAAMGASSGATAAEPIEEDAPHVWKRRATDAAEPGAPSPRVAEALRRAQSRGLGFEREKAEGSEPAPSAGHYGDEEEEPFKLEKYLRRSTDRRPGVFGAAADVVPSPDETTFLKSKDQGRSSDEVTEEQLRELAQDPMWKTLMQFKGWLPVVTSLLPMLDLATGRPQPGTSDEIKDTMDGLLMSHRDIRSTLNSQTTELRRVEQEVAHLREAADKTSFEQSAMADDVRGMQRLMKNASMYMGILLGLLVAVVGYMAFLVFTYLNHPAH